jgi:hypothetical protein
MSLHGVLLLLVVAVWSGGLLSLALWGSWRLTAAWTASAGLTAYAAWLHSMLNARWAARHLVAEGTEQSEPG